PAARGGQASGRRRARNGLCTRRAACRIDPSIRAAGRRSKERFERALAATGRRQQVLGMMDNRNLIIAIVLSLVVLLGGQFFLAGHQIERARQHQLTEQVASQKPAPEPGAASQPATGGSGQVAPAAPIEAATLSREAALKGPRVPIESSK